MRWRHHPHLHSHRHHWRRHHGSHLRKRLFWQIYVVVVGNVVVVSLLVGILLHLRGEGHHLPIFPLLAVAALVVSLGAYPISRRLTYRLERLKRGVDALGEGNLSVRVKVEGCDEVAALAASFNRSAIRIQALLASHRQLLANASHELRSPLARMQMGLALLADSTHTEDSPHLAALRQDIRELDQLVEEILLASRLDTPEIPLERQPVDLAALLAEECARIDADCEAQALQITGDPRLLRRLLRNLLENARRHGGGQVEARLAAGAGQSVLLQVLDRGAGIPAAALEHIFEPFYRPAGHGEGHGGWGLGLSLVKQIAERHGGEVACAPREGGGALFEVTLPRRA
ncbi:ATP-binding protein [Candidatus Thiothrix sp. Deng01]|uniref:histidine kinase n=1 Tax=Candidatus Thiothrix phosphatis TaxID=3112415 RepID=A0ABU6CW72_9GAMM|nr:ATP-binding protein [Candidatus Thiothrix sp. Deng01]MEB4590826.1 ATP-binding protein [Candidatus Thiothrix sp. Deng01]